MKTFKTFIQEDDNKTPPFEGPYVKKSSDVVDKSGAKHTAFSRVRHLAKMGLKKAAEKNDKPTTNTHCPGCYSTDIKTYSDGEKKCHQCHKTWHVKGMAEVFNDTDTVFLIPAAGHPLSHLRYKTFKDASPLEHEKAIQYHLTGADRATPRKAAFHDMRAKMHRDWISGKQGMAEEVEQIDEISKSTYVSAMQTLSDPGTERGNIHYDEKNKKWLDTKDKLINRAKKYHGKKFSKDLEHVYKTHYDEQVEQIDEKSAAWERSEGKNPEGGLNKKGIDSYRRDHPGSKLSLAVTTKPSKLKKGSKAWNRRKSFCARMGGMKKRLTSSKTANDPNSRINKSLRKWNC
jgi:hypothetical protein